jgi:hypothetical protein
LLGFAKHILSRTEAKNARKKVTAYLEQVVGSKGPDPYQNEICASLDAHWFVGLCRLRLRVLQHQPIHEYG